MEDQAPKNTEVETPVQPPVSSVPNTPVVKPKPKFSLVAVIGVILFLLVVGGAASFYLYKQQALKQTACTMEAKVCPDGSSVGRSGSKCEFSPCPTATPDPTANWKTYEGNGFNLKYPSSGLVKNVSFVSSPNYPKSLSNIQLVDRGTTISITVTNNFNNLTLANILGNGPSTSYMQEFLKGKTPKSLLIDNTQGIQAEDLAVGQSGSVSDSILIKDGKIYQITLEPSTSETKTLYNQILSTFRFTDVTPTPSSLPFDCQGEEGCICNTDGDCTSRNCKKETPDTDKSMSSGVCTK